MRNRLFLTLFVVLALALATTAQTKVSGTATCTKPSPAYSIDAGDQAGHALTLDKSACTYTKPMEIAGLKSKDGASVSTGELSGNKLHGGGTHVANMSNGDKFFVSFQGTDTMKDGKPESSEGTWSFTGGTGKLKGIKGKGTYKGKPDAGGNMVFAVEGEYELPKK